MSAKDDRLEQLQTEITNLHCAHKRAVTEIERLRDHLRRFDLSEPEVLLQTARVVAEVMECHEGDAFVALEEAVRRWSHTPPPTDGERP